MSDKKTWAKLAQPADPDQEFKPAKLVFYQLGNSPTAYGHLYESDGTTEKVYQTVEAGLGALVGIPALLRLIDCERVARLLSLPLEVREGPKK
jgi:hypothetical protein